MTTEQPDPQHGTIIVADESLREGFTQIPNAILRRPDVSAGAKLTYMALLSHAWQKDRCFPGQDVLAEELGAGKRSVVRYLQELQQVGLLQIKRRGLGLTNVYILTRSSQSRSANLAHQEVPKTTHQEVPKRHTEEYPSKKTKNEKDISNRIEGSTRQKTAVEETARPGGREQGRGETEASGFSSLRSALVRRREEAGQPKASDPPTPDDDRSVLTAALAPYRQEFGDVATPRSSVTRVLRMIRTHTIPRHAALMLLAEAASRTRESERLGTIEGHCFAYFLSVFGQLLEPETETPASSLAPPRQSSPAHLQEAPAAAKLTATGEKPSPGTSPAVPGEPPPGAITETHPVWKQTLSELQAVMTDANFNTWLATTRVIGQAGETLTIGVPRQFHKDWLERKLSGKIASTMERLGHGGLHVEFVVSNGSSSGSGSG